MRTIHKFPLPAGTWEYEIQMPRNADILCVQMQREMPCIWAAVDDSARMESRRVVIVGTGWELPADMGRSEYVGTFQTDVDYVWHVFAAKPNALRPS